MKTSAVFFQATLLASLAPVPAQAAAEPTLRLRSGAVTTAPGSLRTEAPQSAAEAQIAGQGVLRLAGIGRVRTDGTVKLEQGNALISSGKNFLGRRSLQTSVGPILLSLRGSALLSHVTGQPVKITVLEGTATARLAARNSHFVELPAGSMLMVGESEADLPVPAEVRLARLRETSKLLAQPFGPLPAEAAIVSAGAKQEKELAKRRLVAANVRVRGSQATLGGADDDGSHASGSNSSGGGGSSASASSSSSSGGATAGGGGGGATGAFVCVGCASHATPVGAVSANDPNRLAQIRAESGGDGATARSGPSLPGSKVSSAVTVTNGGSRGDLGTDPPADSTITVKNSTDLNALAQAVVLASFGEAITIDGSSFTRQPGALNVDAGTIFERTLTLRQSSFAADVIKARSFHTGGQDALVIDGSTFNASQLIRLYAEGGGTLRFRGVVALNGPTSELAGSSVQIDAGSLVRAAGPVRVFSDDHQYDKAGFGTLETGGTKTQQPFAARPRY